MNLGLQSRGYKASRTMEELTHTDTLGVASTLGVFFCLGCIRPSRFEDGSFFPCSRKEHLNGLVSFSL
jgi:hypothetical protein